jgi:cytochrome c oxidase subunit 3
MTEATLQQDAVHGLAGEYEAPLFGAYSKKVGMWLFLASDSLTFGALLFAFSYNRISNPAWPTPFGKESIANATLMTACLLSSSLTMVLGVLAAKRGDKSWTRNWLLGTMVFGTAFIILHGLEWTRLIDHGMTPFGWGSAVRRDILHPDRHAHAARDHWRDLFGRGGVPQEVSSCSGVALDCWIFSDSGREYFSLWNSRAGDRVDCLCVNFVFEAEGIRLAGCGSLWFVLALRRSGLDVHYAVGLSDVDEDLARVRNAAVRRGKVPENPSGFAQGRLSRAARSG